MEFAPGRKVQSGGLRKSEGQRTGQPARNAAAGGFSPSNRPAFRFATDRGILVKEREFLSVTSSCNSWGAFVS